jgi:hypothetical protein
MSNDLNIDARLGFCGPEDRVVSLNVPVGIEDGQNNSYHSFDIEYASEQPDTLTIRLFELDQHGFIRTALQSTPFPVDLLAALVSRRKATTEEVARWTSQADEE